MAHFCAAATRPSGRSAWSIIPPPLTSGPTRRISTDGSRASASCVPSGVAPEAMLARLERIETPVLVLAEIERQRLAERGEEEGWEAAARRVELRLRAERPVAGDAPS